MAKLSGQICLSQEYLPTYHRYWWAELLAGNSSLANSSCRLCCQDTMYFLMHSKSKSCQLHWYFRSNRNLAIVQRGRIHYPGKSNFHSNHWQYLFQKEYMPQAHLHLLDQGNRNYYRTICHLDLFTNLAHYQNFKDFGRSRRIYWIQPI